MQIIETEHLILRPFREGDAADLLTYLRAPAARCFLSLKLANLVEAEIEVRKRALDEGCVAILERTQQASADEMCLFPVTERQFEQPTFQCHLTKY